MLRQFMLGYCASSFAVRQGKAALCCGRLIGIGLCVTFPAIHFHQFSLIICLLQIYFNINKYKLFIAYNTMILGIAPSWCSPFVYFKQKLITGTEVSPVAGDNAPCSPSKGKVVVLQPLPCILDIYTAGWSIGLITRRVTQ